MKAALKSIMFLHIYFGVSENFSLAKKKEKFEFSEAKEKKGRFLGVEEKVLGCERGI